MSIMSNYKLTLLAVLIASSVTAQAELSSTNTVCPVGSTNCNITEIGDKDLSADNSVSESTHNNPSSNTNVSGTTINPDNKDVNNNSNDGSITGGNTSSQGGSAIGNKSDNRNDTNSNASNGNQSLDASNSFNAGTTSNKLGQAQGQISSNDVSSSNKVASNNANDIANKLTGGNQGQASSNHNALGQKLASSNSNKVEGSKQGQSSFNDLSTSDNRKQSSNTTSNSGSNSSNKLGNSGNSNTRVDASDRSVSNYTSQALSRAPIIHGGVISLPSPTMNTVVGECSPIPSVATQPVYGTHIGVFKNKSVPLGFTQQLGVSYNSAPFNYFTAPDGAIYEMGVKSVITTSVNNMGSSRSVSANLSRALGEDVGGGAANSSSMQGQVTTVQLVPCLHAVYEPKEPKIQEDSVQNLDYLEHGQKG